MSSGGDGGDDDGDDDDGDGDDVQLDDGDDGVDFPLREGISPADFSPPESSFLSGVLRPAEAAVTLREYMKDIVTNKRKIPNEEISTMLANYSFNGKVPKKLGDPDKLIPTDISLQMADKSTAIPVGICEDVPVQVTNNCLILTDFVVLEMPEDDNMSIILGRPFLNTAGAVIDCNKGKVTFNVDDKEHTVYFPKRIDKKRKMKKFNFGELFKRGTTSTGRPSRTATRLRRSYNEDIIAPSFAPEEDNGAPNASSFPCYDFLTNAGILDDFFTLVNRAGLAAYVGDEREQYYMLTKIFVESFKFHNQYGPTVAFKIYDNPITMELGEFCRALDIAPVGTSRRIDDNPRDLLELYRGITDDDCRTIQRGKIRNIQLPAIKYFAYYIATSILGRENTSNISSYHLAFLNVALTGQTSYHLGSLIARRLSNRGPIFGGTIALRILTHLRLPLDSNDVPLTPRRLDIAAMKSHHFVTTDSTLDNMVYRMLFADGDEKEIPLPQPEGNEDNEVEDQEAPDEPADDDLGRAIADARRECETEKERLAFDKMIEDHNKLLYPTCEDGHKKLGSTLELLQWKAENGVTDSGFGKLLTIIKRKLPRGNELPASTYEAKKIVCPLGLDVQKIHACINDCILYRDEYENLDACPVCTALRYKIRRDDPGDVEGERPRKRVPAKVMWPEGSISKGYGTEEVIEFCVDFIPDLKPIGVPESRHEGRLSGKGTLGRKSMICHMASIVSLTLREAEALCASNYPCPPGYRVPTGWLLSVGGVPVPPVPLGVAREMAITNHYYFELTPEQRRNPQWHPDYSPTWDSFFINRRERALARHEEGGPPPSNFNEAGRRLWWRDRTLQGVMAHRGPRLRYPQSQPTRALPPRFDYRDPDASDDDDGDYDDYSGEYYRARHEYD
ncbi:hypothetical protein QYE76_008894 [Lolium multiflorum]|uniref:Arabidopsis retrotransposon Orf1 C-terminal domain-containing protein n=1 Tax=Lolium multiflorum TaxID=4521 RepID=A0AAD8TSK4_LOLMU|nr:hypothetical protein QYE76_008894 [Lolium multiflorum]